MDVPCADDDLSLGVYDVGFLVRDKLCTGGREVAVWPNFRHDPADQGFGEHDQVIPVLVRQIIALAMGEYKSKHRTEDRPGTPTVTAYERLPVAGSWLFRVMLMPAGYDAHGRDQSPSQPMRVPKDAHRRHTKCSVMSNGLDRKDHNYSRDAGHARSLRSRMSRSRSECGECYNPYMDTPRQNISPSH